MCRFSRQFAVFMVEVPNEHKQRLMWVFCGIPSRAPKAFNLLWDTSDGTNGMPAVVKKKNSHGEPIEVNLTMEVDLQGNLLWKQDKEF